MNTAANGQETTDDFEASFAEAMAGEATNDKPADKPAEVKAEGEQVQAQSQDPGTKTEGEQTQAKAEAQPDQLADLQRQLSEALHRERSSSGRISSFSRENDQLKQDNAQLRQRVNLLEQQLANSPANGGGSGDADDALSEAPELRQAVANMVERTVAPLRQQAKDAETRAQEANQRAQQAAQAFEPIAKERAEQELQSIFGGLTERYEGWREEIKTPRFKTWLDAQPKAIKSMYLEGETLSESTAVLDLYSSQTAHLKRKEPGQAESAQDIAAQRQQRLAKSTGVKSGAAAAPSAPKKDDFEGSFSEFATGLAKA